jgi:quinoprotein relay system zinc metallohydrolase 2
VQEEVTRGNLGAIANGGFVVGAKCVAAIDPGGSYDEGLALRNALASRTRTPVCYVINTHMHPDHIFGNAAFKRDDVKFVGHSKLPAAMAARGDTYLHALQRELGDAAAGSDVIAPDLLVNGTMSLDLGGRKLELRAWKTAHTDNDLTIYDDKSGTLWLGDLLFVDRIPALDGNLRGWLAAIKELRSMRVRHAVPGHGRARELWPQPLASEERYLASLADDVKAAIRLRLSLQQTVDKLGNIEQQKWLLFDAYHRRNVTAAYAELEWED